jgi:hypothetical protein
LLIRIPNPFTYGAEPSLIGELENLSYRNCPTWLGNFQFKMIKSLDKLPKLIQEEFLNLNSLVPAQVFNTWFIQKYEPGQNVSGHKDPLNNKGLTVVSLYGNLWHTVLTVDSQKFNQNPGQIFIFPTNIPGLERPYHKVDWSNPKQQGCVSYTTRWALICNTIEN